MVLDIIKTSCPTLFPTPHHFSASILLFFLLSFLYYPTPYFVNNSIIVLPLAYLLAALLAISFQVDFATQSQSYPNFFLKLAVLSFTFDNLYIDVKWIVLCFDTTNILLTLSPLSTSKKSQLHHIQSLISGTEICGTS